MQEHSILMRAQSALTVAYRASCAALESSIASQHRQNSSAALIKVRHLQSAKALEVTFSDRQSYTLPAELLRISSPAADSSPQQGRSSSKKVRLRKQRAQADSEAQVLSGRRHVGIMRVEAIGNYAVRLQFDDLHGSGIYPGPLLRDLGEHKVRHMRNYLRALRAQGLSRDPAASRTRASIS